MYIYYHNERTKSKNKNAVEIHDNNRIKISMFLTFYVCKSLIFVYILHVTTSQQKKFTKPGKRYLSSVLGSF